MSCLLPQFKCQPDTFSIHFRAHPHVTLPSSHSHSHSHLAKNRETVCFQAHCLLSATSPSTSSSNGSTAVLSLEKLALTTLDGNSDSVATNRPWTYIGTTGPPTEASFKATLATESLITSEEAVIAAAASEAVALAKAAVKVAKDAAMLAKNKSPIESEYKPSVSSKPDNLLLKWVRHMEAEDGLVGGSLGTEAETMRDCSINNNEEESDDVEPTNEELESLEEQLFGNIAVRSKRQTERKARRARAAERASTNSLSFKSSSSSRKKRTATQEVDYTDPLRYLRATTSTSKLLSPTEELELSEGIQDLLKLEKLQNDLAERCGCPPTFAQWAAAARVDGTFCKDKMIKSNIRLVISIATNYQGAGMNLQDLVQMEQNDQATKGKQKMWSTEEDKVLVDCLVTLKTDQKYMADNGFKSGFANALQSMMEEKLPGCGIKACPHITSRIKTLKKLWQTAYDMVYGVNTSGFGWDPDTKCVTADKDVWDEYIKIHSRAGQFRTKSFPYFESLSMVWGKDRAVGDEVSSPVGMEDEVNLEDEDLPETPAHVTAESAFTQPMNETAPTALNGADPSTSRRKKRRLNHSEIMADALRDTVSSLDNTIVGVFDKLCNQMSAQVSTQISTQQRQADIDAKGDNLFIELLEVEDLTWSERTTAHIKILGCEKLLKGFASIPAAFKATWIRSLLQQ